MSSLLERHIASVDERLVVLAPPNVSPAGFFRNVSVDAERHADYVRQMQRLRGSVYLSDGALQPRDLSSDGRHRTAEDERSWHLLILNRARQVNACIWYLEHEDPISIQQLRVRSSPVASAVNSPLRDAVHSELARARREQVRYSEVGGWAVSEQSRCTSEGLILILATFGLSRILGGALGVATATARHSSATILQRLGLTRFEVDGFTVPPYYDSKYDCEMEVLKYDTRRSSPKYHRSIEMLKDRIANMTVLAATGAGMHHADAAAEVAA